MTKNDAGRGRSTELNTWTLASFRNNEDILFFRCLGYTVRLVCCSSLTVPYPKWEWWFRWKQLPRRSTATWPQPAGERTSNKGAVRQQEGYEAPWGELRREAFLGQHITFYICIRVAYRYMEQILAFYWEIILILLILITIIKRNLPIGVFQLFHYCRIDHCYPGCQWESLNLVHTDILIIWMHTLLWFYECPEFQW